MSKYHKLRTVTLFQHTDGQNLKVGGYRLDPEDANDKRYGTDRYSAEELPAMVDLRAHMTEVEQQGHLSSCTANAMAGAYEYLAIRETGTSDRVSRLFIYYNARDCDGTTNVDQGAYLRHCIQVLREYGTCNEQTWPYDPDLVFSQPDEEAYEEAKNFLIDEAERINIDLHDMRHCLAEGYPFAFGLQLFESFGTVESTGKVSTPNPAKEKHAGGHAMLCVGYSDKDKVFLVRNSWGTTWGDKGYCYIPYDYMTNPELIGDCWTIKSVTDVDYSQSGWSDEGSFFGEFISSLVGSLGFTAKDDGDEDEEDEDDGDEYEDEDGDEDEDDGEEYEDEDEDE